MAPHNYEPPVDALLRCGQCQGINVNEWPNYVQEFGLTTDHISALIQMAQDEQLWTFFGEDYDREDEFLAAGIPPKEALWAPIHAWRSLGQLQAAEAVIPLVEVLQQRDYDWCWEELPQVFGLIGAEAIDPLGELIPTQLQYNNKVSIISAFGEIVKTFPDLRDRCVAVLTRQLSDFKNHHRTVNGALIAELLDLKVLEAVPLMEAAYNAKKVDEMFVGSWAAVQVELGLKQESDFTAEELAIHYTPAQKKSLANVQAYLNRQKSKSPRSSMSANRSGFEPAEFKDIAAQVGTRKLPDKAGFGIAAQAGSKRGQKKKKK